MFVSAARVTGPLGPPTTDGSYVRTVEEARAYVRRLKADVAGVDHMKVDLTITDEELRAVIEEAGAAGLKVLAHTQNIRQAVEMGMKHMDTIAARFSNRKARNRTPKARRRKPPSIPGCFRR